MRVGLWYEQRWMDGWGNCKSDLGHERGVLLHWGKMY